MGNPQYYTKEEIDAMFPEGNTSAYKVYTALLSQTGTNPPTAIVLKNTLGGTVVWTRSNIGSYIATLAGAFTAQKTIVFMQQVSLSGSGVGMHQLVTRYTNDTILLNTYINDSAPSSQDSLLPETPIEIRVYN